MALVLAIANHKGGAGKTTVTVQTAAALARAGKRVLVVDLDPQANATEGLGLLEDPDFPRPGLVEAWDRTRNPSLSAASVVSRCGWLDASGVATTEADLIDVIPARFDLENEELRWQDADAKHRLTLSLEGWADAYDVVLVDTRPSLGLLVAEAFMAADAVLIVTEPGRRSLYGAKRVYDFVSQLARRGNPRLNIVTYIRFMTFYGIVFIYHHYGSSTR